MAKTNAKNTTTGPFVLNNEATYPWTVYVFVPSANGGKNKLKFKAEFKHLTAARRLEVLNTFRDNLKARAGLEDSQSEDAPEVTVKDVASFEELLLDEVLLGFSGIVDASGQDVPFNEDTKAALISNSWARDALLHAYQQSLVGRSDLGN